MKPMDPKDEEAMAVVTQMLGELVEAAKSTAGAAWTKEAEDWWVSHYRGSFFHAVKIRCKKYPDAKDVLLGRARALGALACQLAAGQKIGTLHAAIASHSIDCPPNETREEWCN